MREKDKMIAIAVCVTTLDVAVICYSGPVIWWIWEEIPWVRVVLLLLAGTAAFTLLDIWSRNLSSRVTRSVSPQDGGGAPMGIFPSETLEGSDV